MFAQFRRHARRDLGFAQDVERAHECFHGRVRHLHHHAGFADLRIVIEIGEDADNTEGDLRVIQNKPPFGEAFGRENLIEQGSQCARIHFPRVLVIEAGIFQQRRMAQRAGQPIPLPCLVNKRQHEPAAIAALIGVGARIGGMFPCRAALVVRVAEARLHRATIGPQPIGEQRGINHAPLPCPFPPVQRGDDGAVKTHGTGMIAHARQRPRRRRVRIRFYQIHQARACPVGGGIKPRFVRFRPRLPISGEASIDQPWIEPCEVFIRNTKARAHRRRIVGNKHIGLPDQRIQSLPRRRLLQIERDGALVPRFQDPVIVPLRRWIARTFPGMAECVAGPDRFHFNHVSTEIAQGRRRGGRGDVSGAIDDLQAREYSV